jgi:hypothetical protein
MFRPELLQKNYGLYMEHMEHYGIKGSPTRRIIE